MKRLRHVFARLLLGFGLLALGGAMSGCTKQDSLCAQACKNYAAKCNVGRNSSSGSSSSLGGQDCVQMCSNGLASRSRSSGAAYTDMLFCVANAQSCAEIQSACSP